MKQRLYYTQHLKYSLFFLLPFLPLSISLDAFESKIRQWEPDCSCRLCKTYLQHVSFIQFFITYFSKSTIKIMFLIRFESMLLSCLIFFIFLQLCIYICTFVCLFASWTQGVNWACNKTFRKRPECLRDALCTFRLLVVSRAGTYIQF